MRHVALLFVLAIATGCSESKTIELNPVDGSSVRGTASVHEALSKSFATRVDAFVEIDEPAPGMTAGFVKGSCAAPGQVLQVLQVHRTGEGGAAEIVLAEGKLSDLGGHSIHVFAGEPEASVRLACGDL